MGAKDWEVWRSRWEKGWTGKKEKIEEKQQKGEANDKRQGKGWPVHLDVMSSCTASSQCARRCAHDCLLSARVLKKHAFNTLCDYP